MPWFPAWLPKTHGSAAQYKDQVEDLGANLTGASWFSSASLHGCKFDR